MGTFFDTPFGDDRSAFALPTGSIRVETKTYGTQSRPGSAGNYAISAVDIPFPFDQFPWDGSIFGRSVAGAKDPLVPVTDFTVWQANVDAAVAAAAAQQTALAVALSAVAAAQTTVDEAQTTVDEAQNTLNALESSAYIAWLGLLAAERGGNAALIAEYTTRNQDAVHDVVAQKAVLLTARNALIAAQTILTEKRDYHFNHFWGFDGGARDIAAAQFALAIAQSLYGNPSSDGGPPGPPYYNDYSGGSAGVGDGRVALRQVDDDSSGGTVERYGRYRLAFILTDGQYRQLAADGGNIRVRWTEVTYQAGARVDPPPGLFPDTIVGAVQKSQVLSANDAVQMIDGSGRRTFYTAAYDVAVPGDNQWVIIAGPERVKNYTDITAFELRGAEARRIGWREFTTAPGGAYGRRYLAMTLSATPDAPVGNHYTGTLDPLNFAGDLTDPALVGALLDQAQPDNIDAIALRSTLLGPTVRVLSDPPGLRLTLSDEETPASIQDAVAASAVLDDPERMDFIPTVNGAINCCPPSGDYAAKQTLRFVPQYVPGGGYPDGRAVPAFSEYFEYTRRTTNLTTGIATSTQVGKTVNYTYVPANPAAGTLDAWHSDSQGVVTTIGVPGPMTLVEVFPSESAPLRAETPYGNPVLSFESGAGGE